MPHLDLMGAAGSDIGDCPASLLQDAYFMTFSQYPCDRWQRTRPKHYLRLCIGARNKIPNRAQSMVDNPRMDVPSGKTGNEQCEDKLRLKHFGSNVVHSTRTTLYSPFKGLMSN